MNKRFFGPWLAPTPFCLALLACHPAGTGVIPQASLVAPDREPLIIKQPTTAPAPNTVVAVPETVAVMPVVAAPVAPPLAPMLTRSAEHPATTEQGVADVRFIGPTSCTIETNGVRALFSPHTLPSLSPSTVVRKGPSKKGGRQLTPLTAEQIKERLQVSALDVVAVNHVGINGLQSVTARALERAYHPTFVVPKGSKAALVRLGVPASHVLEVVAMEEVAVGHDAHITLVPAPESHVMPSLRGKGPKARAALVAKAKAAENNDAGYVLRDGNAVFYVAGEGKDGTQFADVHNRFGSPDVAVLNVALATTASNVASSRLTRIEAEKAQTQLNSTVTIGLPMAAGEKVATPTLPRTAGSLVPCMVAPIGGETLHIALGHHGPCEATSDAPAPVVPAAPVEPVHVPTGADVYVPAHVPTK